MDVEKMEVEKFFFGRRKDTLSGAKTLFLKFLPRQLLKISNSSSIVVADLKLLHS